MRRVIAALTVVFVITTLTGAVAQATLTQVNVRIEGKTKTLFEGPIWTEGHDVHSSEPDGGNAAEDLEEHPCDGINPLDPQNATPGPTPTAASVDAMSLAGETEPLDGQWYPGFEDYFVKQWGAEAENAEREGKSWGILVNNTYTNVGGCQYELGTGDEVLWIFNAFESKPILGLFAADEHYSYGVRPLTAIAQLGQPFEVEVDAYDDHAEDKPPLVSERTTANTTPYAGAEVSPVQTSSKGFETVQAESSEKVTTNSEGKASITFITPGWHRIKAGTALNAKGEETAIRSNRLDVCVPATGQSGCGEPPAEDQTRTPPRYLKEGNNAAPHQETGVGADKTGVQPGSGANTAPATTNPTTTADPVTRLAGASINSSGLLLELTAAGKVTVTIAQEVGMGRRRRWRTVKQIAVQAQRAGTIKVKLPRLPAGRYRVTISLPRIESVVKMLTVAHTRR